MQTNLLTNPYLPYTLEDLLFEKQAVQEPIANNVSLSAARRADALTKVVLIDEVLGVFQAAAENDLIGEDDTHKTGEQIIEETMGKSIDDLRKGAGIAAKAGQAVGVGAKVAKKWLNKSAEWIAEKTK